MDTKNIKTMRSNLLKVRKTNSHDLKPSPRVKASIKALVPKNTARIKPRKQVNVLPNKTLTADGYEWLSKKN